MLTIKKSIITGLVFLQTFSGCRMRFGMSDSDHRGYYGIETTNELCDRVPKFNESVFELQTCYQTIEEDGTGVYFYSTDCEGVPVLEKSYLVFLDNHRFYYYSQGRTWEPADLIDPNFPVSFDMTNKKEPYNRRGYYKVENQDIYSFIIKLYWERPIGKKAEKKYQKKKLKDEETAKKVLYKNLGFSFVSATYEISRDGNPAYLFIDSWKKPTTRSRVTASDRRTEYVVYPLRTLENPNNDTTADKTHPLKFTERKISTAQNPLGKTVNLKVLYDGAPIDTIHYYNGQDTALYIFNSGNRAARPVSETW